MATLHIISCNLSSQHALASHIKHCLQPDDALLFLSKGVYSTCVALFADYKLFRLVSETSLATTADNIQEIDYAQFVQLGVDYERSLSWC